MNVYRKYTLEFCNKILSSNTRYLLSIKCKRMGMPLRMSPLHKEKKWDN